MKNKKSLLFSLIVILVVALFCFCGCNSNNSNNSNSGLSIVSIEKTKTEGLKDIYTITYSDGSEYSFEITNGQDGEDGEDGADGQDGKDGEDLNIADIYKDYLERNPNATYEEFLRDVLEINTTTNTLSINTALQSSAKI